jgi:hypothetical protein
MSKPTMPVLSPPSDKLKPKRQRRKPHSAGQSAARVVAARGPMRSDLEERLDAGLEETFPASDPVAVNSRSD